MHFIQRIILNLTNNAIKFTNSGYIQLATSWIEQTQHIDCKITDTGIGIAKDQQEEIFEMFSRINCHSNNTNKGMDWG